MKRTCLLSLGAALWLAAINSATAAEDIYLGLDCQTGIPMRTTGKLVEAVEVEQFGGEDPIYVEGKDGQPGAVKFPSTGFKGSGLHIVGSAGRLGLTGDSEELSITGWIKVLPSDAKPLQGKRCIISNLGRDENNGWMFGANPNGSILFFWGRDDNKPAVIRVSEHKVGPGEWHHVAMVWKTNDAYGLQFYIDGYKTDSMVGSRTVNSKGTATIPHSDEDFRVGMTPSGTFPLFGEVRVLRLYDRALTADEVVSDLEAGKTP